jgi:flagellar hook-associated protein 1 FlgK
LLKGPQGERVGETTVAVTGSTIGDMVDALNTSFTGKATFTLDANGQLQVTPAVAYAGYNLEVTADSTSRGTTGESLSSLFGLGTGQAMARAQSFDLRSDITPQRLGFAKPALDATTLPGASVVTAGDNRGLLALQDLSNQVQSFAAAGALPARNATFGDYAGAFYQDVGGVGTASTMPSRFRTRVFKWRSKVKARPRREPRRRAGKDDGLPASLQCGCAHHPGDTTAL